MEPLWLIEAQQFLQRILIFRELPMKEPVALLSSLRDISKRLNQLASEKAEYELDADAIVDLNMARASVDKLINRVERLVN